MSPDGPPPFGRQRSDVTAAWVVSARTQPATSPARGGGPSHWGTHDADRTRQGPAASRTRAAGSGAGARRPARYHARRGGPGVERSRGAGGDLGDRGGPRTDRPPTGDPTTCPDSRDRP